MFRTPKSQNLVSVGRNPQPISVGPNKWRSSFYGTAIKSMTKAPNCVSKSKIEPQSAPPIALSLAQLIYQRSLNLAERGYLDQMDQEMHHLIHRNCLEEEKRRARIQQHHLHQLHSFLQSKLHHHPTSICAEASGSLKQEFALPTHVCKITLITSDGVEFSFHSTFQLGRVGKRWIDSSQR